MNDSLDTVSSEASNQDKLKRQAKQRFIGAAVLVLMAVVALPFVLESQPRPLPASVVIDIPKMDATPALTDAPKPPSEQPAPPAAIAIPAAPEKVAAPLVFKEFKPNDGARAAALLNDTPTSHTAKPPKSKYIVQAGSFSDPAKLQAAAAKLDKAGIAHYTQAAEGKDGTPRTRLRLTGPFATRDEANIAAAKVAKLGVASIVLKPQ